MLDTGSSMRKSQIASQVIKSDYYAKPCSAFGVSINSFLGIFHDLLLLYTN